MLRFYGYAKCQTCRDAKKWLEARGFELEEVDITVSPPNASELKKIIQQSGKNITDFLNRSGQKYRELNMKDKVKTHSEAELIKMLSEEGRLLKRPIVTNDRQASVGFKELDFKLHWTKN